MQFFGLKICPYYSVLKRMKLSFTCILFYFNFHLSGPCFSSIIGMKNYLQDYGIDFDDHDHPIKAFRCCCGSTLCRDKKRKGQSGNPGHAIACEDFILVSSFS